MTPSQKAYDLIKHFEGCRLTAYRDPVGIWTIGYGHTGVVNEGMVITQERAEELLRQDADDAARHLDAWVDSDAKVTQSEFDALVSFVFNLGVNSFLGSTLARKLIGGDKAGAAAEFLKWCHAGGKSLPGLVARRQAEMELFLS